MEKWNFSGSLMVVLLVDGCSLLFNGRGKGEKRGVSSQIAWRERLPFRREPQKAGGNARNPGGTRGNVGGKGGNPGGSRKKPAGAAKFPAGTAVRRAGKIGGAAGVTVGRAGVAKVICREVAGSGDKTSA